jgi:hypothetical protein
LCDSAQQYKYGIEEGRGPLLTGKAERLVIERWTNKPGLGRKTKTESTH